MGLNLLAQEMTLPFLMKDEDIPVLNGLERKRDFLQGADPDGDPPEKQVLQGKTAAGAGDQANRPPHHP
jgi:hypothetical protein